MKCLNLRLGENFCDLILQMSQEKILSDNPQKAIDLYMGGFPGITEEQTLSILKGEYHLTVNEDGTGVLFEDGPDEDSRYYDWISIIGSRLNELWEHSKEVIKQANTLIAGNNELFFSFQEFLGSSSFALAVDLLYIFERKLVSEFALDNIKEIAYSDLDSMDNGCDYGNRLVGLIYRYYANVSDLFKELKSFEIPYYWLRVHGFLEKDGSDIRFYSDKISVVFHALDQFAHEFGFMITEMKYANVLLQGDIKKYSSFDYDRWRSNGGILESNIMDGYDAGWLSPDGKFYGGNGPINNLIHLNLAESIINKPPMGELPERYLETHGWLKIHHDRVYGLFRFKKEDDSDIRLYCPTKKQMEVLKGYIDKHYKGKINVDPTGNNIIDFRSLLQMDDVQLHLTFTGG